MKTQTITPAQFATLNKNPRYHIANYAGGIIPPHATRRVKVKGGGEYILTPYAKHITIYSRSQLSSRILHAESNKARQVIIRKRIASLASRWNVSGVV